MATKTVKAPALKLLTTVKAIDAGIKSLHEMGQSLQTHMHVVACSVLKHLGQHGDIRMLHKLLLAMPEASRTNALRDWFAEFGPVSFDGNDAVYDKNKPVRLGDAMATPFWKFKPEAEYQPVDPRAKIMALIKTLQKDQEKVKGVDHSETITALERILSGKPVGINVIPATVAQTPAQPTIQ